MKLRLENESVRFRLSPEDVDQLEREKRLGAITRLSPETSWNYSIEASQASIARIEATGSLFRLLVPTVTLAPWLRSAEIELNFSIDGLHVAVEKDLKPQKRSTIHG